MKLGIVPERIQPAHPEQNGRHERMHLTLQQETMTAMAANRRAQQRRFDQSRREYNHERPHESLAMQTPAACYAPSPRAYPARVPEPEYGTAMIVRRVQASGEFSWEHEDVFLSETLEGERIALEAIDDRWYTVYFADFPWRSSTVAPARFNDCAQPTPSTSRMQGKRNCPLPLHPIPKTRTKNCQPCPRSKMSIICPAGQSGRVAPRGRKRAPCTEVFRFPRL